MPAPRKMPVKSAKKPMDATVNTIVKMLNMPDQTRKLEMTVSKKSTNHKHVKKTVESQMTDNDAMVLVKKRDLRAILMHLQGLSQEI